MHLALMLFATDHDGSGTGTQDRDGLPGRDADLRPDRAWRSVIVPFWFICKKAGFSPWLSLLNIDSPGQPGAAVRSGVCGVEGGAGAVPPQMGYPYPPPPPRV